MHYRLAHRTARMTSAANSQPMSVLTIGAGNGIGRDVNRCVAVVRIWHVYRDVTTPLARLAWRTILVAIVAVAWTARPTASGAFIVFEWHHSSFLGERDAPRGF